MVQEIKSAMFAWFDHAPFINIALHEMKQEIW